MGTVLLSIFCCVAGAYIFYSSAMGVICNTELLVLDRGTCPSDFLPLQSKGRRILIANGLARLGGSCAVLIGGACSMSTLSAGCEGVPRSIILWTGMVICLWSVLSVLISKVFHIDERRDEIDANWKKEKRISSRHDDEVRLFRILEEILGIPKRNVFLFILMVVAFILSHA